MAADIPLSRLVLQPDRARPNAPGDVLYDIETGQPDRAVEDRVDHVPVQYLDQLVDLTYREYFGAHVLESVVRGAS